MKMSHGAFIEIISTIDEQSKSNGLRNEEDRSSIREPSSFFGRLFNKSEDQPSEVKLNKLAELMLEENEDIHGDSRSITTGMTFLGQFIDHDLTFDTLSNIERPIETASPLANFRTPRFDLDSVYLRGPEVNPFLYNGKGKFMTGSQYNENDLPRNSSEVAIIGDPRNDENLFLSQLHLAFLKFHNALMENGQYPGNFSKTREVVQRTYQSIILQKYLPAIVHTTVLAPLLKQFYKKQLDNRVASELTPDMPVEFSAAAFRFGHSQIRSEYFVNTSNKCKLFEVGGFKVIPNSKNIEWNLFFDFGDSKVQFARKIDTNIASELYNMPKRISGEEGNSLPRRNLSRGRKTFELPSGEFIAAELGVENPLRPQDLPKTKEAKLNQIPLWFYVLAEAEQSEFDGQLGTVGGSIVAGTILNLLLRDKNSIAYNPITPSDLGWNEFSMANLIKTAFGP